VWEGTCDVCDEKKPVTEVRDWGYLGKGIQELKGTIQQQSKTVADYMLTVGPIMDDAELEEALEERQSYERGEITLKLTEDEVGFLNECLDTIQEWHPTLQPGEGGYEVPEDIALFESIEEKITELYDDHCVKYQLSPALKKFYELYGTYGTENEQERAKWEVFRDAFHAGADHAKETA
jgi:hypothetical protein